MMPPRLGIIAGDGGLPRAIIAECQRLNRPYFVIALKGHAQADAVAESPHAWIRLGAAGAMIAAFRRQNISEIVLAGSVNRPRLWELCPDLWALAFFARTGVARKGDNSLLEALIADLEAREGFRVVGAHDLLPGVLATTGQMGAHEPALQDQADVDLAREAALELGRQDIGQAAVARQGGVLRREDASGTAAMLSSIMPLQGQPASGVLVKVSKPGQELRADMPTIGPDTIRQICRAGLAGVAVEAGKSMILEKPETLRLADEAGVFVLGLAPDREANQR